MNSSAHNGGTSIAFVDVLTCSLGGAVLLFLIFSTLSQQGSRESRADVGVLQEDAVQYKQVESGEETDTSRMYVVTLRPSATLSVFGEDLDPDATPRIIDIGMSSRQEGIKPNGMESRYVVILPKEAKPAMFKLVGSKPVIATIESATAIHDDSQVGQLRLNPSSDRAVLRYDESKRQLIAVGGG